MRCPNCQRENDPSYRFCILCGTSLPTLTAQGISETGKGSQVETEMTHVGLMRRFVAWIIDAVILIPMFILPGYLYVEINDIPSSCPICRKGEKLYKNIS